MSLLIDLIIGIDVNISYLIDKYNQKMTFFSVRASRTNNFYSRVNLGHGGIILKRAQSYKTFWRIFMNELDA